MRKETIDFALTHPQVHIAVVSRDHQNALTQLHATRTELHPFVKDILVAHMKIRLLNGACLYFATANYDRLRGCQFDRIEVMPGVAELLPEKFLETRLKPGIVPEEGVVSLLPEPERSLNTPLKQS